MAPVPKSNCSISDFPCSGPKQNAAPSLQAATYLGLVASSLLVLACAHKLCLGPAPQGHSRQLSSHLILAKSGCPKALEIQTSTESPQPRECQLLEASTKQEVKMRSRESVIGWFPFSRDRCGFGDCKRIKTQGPASTPLYGLESAGHTQGGRV